MGAAMIFPIQPPLTERDDKAATVIIAVVYGARWPPKCASSVIYRSPLTFFLFSSIAAHIFIFSLSRLCRRYSASENIFVVPQIASEATSPWHEMTY